jgi:NAD+ diphosphatase
MTALHHDLLICDNDKFACIGGLPFFYPCEDMPAQAVKVNTDEAGNSIYAIAYQDIDLSQLPEEITGQIEFLRFRHLIGSLDSRAKTLMLSCAAHTAADLIIDG